MEGEAMGDTANRQGVDRQTTRHHQNDGDDPGEDRAL